MKIKVVQANGVWLTKWQMWALKHGTGAEAHVDFGAVCGTTEVVPCYKANPCRPFSSKAGDRLIFIQEKCFSTDRGRFCHRIDRVGCPKFR